VIFLSSALVGSLEKLIVFHSIENLDFEFFCFVFFKEALGFVFQDFVPRSKKYIETMAEQQKGRLQDLPCFYFCFSASF